MVLQIVSELNFYLSVFAIVPVVVTILLFYRTRMVDFLIGSFIFLNLFLTVGIFGLNSHAPFIPLLENEPLSLLKLIYVLQITLFFAFGLNAIMTAWDQDNPLLVKLFMIISVSGAIGLFFYIFLTPFNARFPYWNNTYQWAQLYKCYNGCIMFYYFLILKPPSKSQTVKNIRYAYLGIASIFIITSIFDGLWSFNAKNGVSNDFVNRMSDDINPYLNLTSSILILIILFLYPQFYVLSKAQIYRARYIYTKIETEPNIPILNQLKSYIKSIPPELISPLEIVSST